jgi:hypothetical protein
MRAIRRYSALLKYVLVLLYEVGPYRNVTPVDLLVALGGEALRRPVKIRFLDPGDR